MPRGGPEGVAQDSSFAVRTLGSLTGIGDIAAVFLCDHLEQGAAEAERF